MKSQPTRFSLGFLLAVGLIAWNSIVTPSAHAAPTIWTGPTTNFDQALNGANDVSVVPVPEPSSMVLCAVALAVLWLLQTVRSWLRRNPK